MQTTTRSTRLALPIIGALALMLGAGLSPAFAGEDPKEVLGFGEATTPPFVTYELRKGGTQDVKSFGKKSLGAIGDVVGNRITFAFGATKDAEGNVQGQMFLVDHALNLSISSDVATFVASPKFGPPVGVKGYDFIYPVKMVSSKTSVIVNGEPRPDWTFVNSPVFDGVKDTVCFELKNPDGEKVYQWDAFLSAGNVELK